MQIHSHVPLQCQDGESCWINLKLFHLTNDPTQGSVALLGYTGLKLQAGWEMSLVWECFQLLSNLVSLQLKSFTFQTKLKLARNSNNSNGFS